MTQRFFPELAHVEEQLRFGMFPPDDSALI